jgi:transcriptional antiterminator RfaH
MNKVNIDDWSVGWYCLRAKPRMEMLASQTLNTLSNVEVFLPRTVRPQKLKPHSPKPLFPGYFFARFDPVIDLRNVQFARGVAYIIKRKEVPVQVFPQVMLELNLLSPSGVFEIPDQPHKIGDKVTALSGLFKGDTGKVTQLIPARERVKVLFEILGRQTEVEIDENKLDFPSAHPLSSRLT